MIAEEIETMVFKENTMQKTSPERRKQTWGSKRDLTKPSPAN